MLNRTLTASLAALALAAPGAAQDGYSLTADVPFSTDPPLAADIYAPEAVTDDTAVILYMHRGTFQSGSKGSAKLFAQEYARSGYLVVAPAYRQYPDGQFPDFINDAASAVEWVWQTQRRSDGAPRPIVLSGYGSGAYIAALVALDPRYIAATEAPREAITALLALPGPYDGGRCIDLPCPHIFPEETRADWQIAQFASAGDPPMLLIKAEHTEIPELEDIAPTVAAAQAAGVDVTGWVAEGRYPKNVLWDACEPDTPTRAVIDAFLARVLDR